MKLMKLTLVLLALFVKLNNGQFFSSIMDFLLRGQQHIRLEQIDDTKGMRKTEFDFIVVGKSDFNL